jgi:hypothetical protein
MVYELVKLAVDGQEVQVNENEEVEAGECYALSLFYFIFVFIFRVIFDGRTTSARAAREARDGAWVQIRSLYYS